MLKALSGVLKVILSYKVLNIAVCINKYWGFSLLLLYIMDSNRREYNLVCKQKQYQKISTRVLPKVHLHSTRFKDDLHPLFRKVGCDTV